MPAAFITFLVFLSIWIIGLAFIGAATVLSSSSADREAARVGLGFVGIIGAIIVAIPLVWGSTTIVSTRNIGVETKFNKPTGVNFTNGFHWKSPLTKVHEMDGSIQNLNRTGDNATQVRLGNNSMASVDNTIQWRIKPDAASSLYLDYKSFDGVKDNLVVRQANAALNEALGTYDPVADLNTQEATNINSKLAAEVKAILTERVGDRIEIMQVILPVIRFDEATQHRIDAFNTEVAATRVAEQRQQTARADAEANRIISDSVKNDPNVVTSRCIDKAIEKGISPAGCWPGSGVLVAPK